MRADGVMMWPPCSANCRPQRFLVLEAIEGDGKQFLVAPITMPGAIARPVDRVLSNRDHRGSVEPVEQQVTEPTWLVVGDIPAFFFGQKM
ncbi:hypothetical protein Van01_65070 [Micromonospora andamanensis]|uniref:Uncharacterized protein n=1 Tax=Micromonospora andamanensis TaxID=1287068 RepID=A0ABQ4I621_9ACTN|nr:hypothetical protein Van01_65070 [Micromonospora andamanensis]